MNPLLRVRQLQFAWSIQSDLLLNIDSFDVRAEESVFIYGPSGVGKSTFLNLIAGVLTPQQGEIFFLGRDLVRLRSGEKYVLRGENMGFIFQMFNLIP